MNINKRLKPDLLDPKYKDKITRTLTKPQRDYWKPTKNFFQSIYENYIQPNIYFFILLIIIIILLLCRYRMIQNQRIEEAFRIEQDVSVSQQVNSATMSDIAMDIYRRSKEDATEPRIKIEKNTSRVEWATPEKTFAQLQNAAAKKPLNKPQFAYPIYPYAKGTLLPPTAR